MYKANSNHNHSNNHNKAHNGAPDIAVYVDQTVTLEARYKHRTVYYHISSTRSAPAERTEITLRYGRKREPAKKPLTKRQLLPFFRQCATHGMIEHDNGITEIIE